MELPHCKNTGRGDLNQNGGCPGTRCSLPDVDVHMEYRACFLLPNGVPPRSCASRIQRGPSMVSHTTRPQNGSSALSPAAAIRCCSPGSRLRLRGRSLAATSWAATRNHSWTGDLRALCLSWNDPSGFFGRTQRAKTKGRRANDKNSNCWSQGFHILSICN